MSDSNSTLTAQRLRELLNYNQDTGIFTRKIKISRGTVAGEVVGGADNLGYIRISIGNKRYLAHRLAWLFVTGSWPVNCVDHINGKTGDNRIKNLRDISLSSNQANRQGPQKNNKTGFLGVQLKREKWTARIRKNGVVTWLGCFPTPELASDAYLAAKRVFHHEIYPKEAP